MRRTYALFAVAVPLLFPALAPSAELSSATLRSAAQKGLALLQKTSPTFIKKGGCNSCHNQMLPAAAQALARRRGIPTRETLAPLPPSVPQLPTERIIESSAHGATPSGHELFAYGAANRPADAR